MHELLHLKPCYATGYPFMFREVPGLPVLLRNKNINAVQGT